MDKVGIQKKEESERKRKRWEKIGKSGEDTKVKKKQNIFVRYNEIKEDTSVDISEQLLSW